MMSTDKRAADQSSWLQERLERRRAKARRLMPGISPLLIAVLLIALGYAGIVGWLVLTGPPGESAPEVVVALSPQPDTPAGDEETGNLTGVLRPASPDPQPQPQQPVSPQEPATVVPGGTHAPAPETPSPEPEAPESGSGQDTAPEPLAKAPIDALVSEGKYGPLPVIAADGRRPWKAYAGPHEAGDGPAAALVVGGLGISRNATVNAIETLPAAVTLAFAPYGDNLQRWIDKARADGHEVILELPMEPFDYPNNDPGPYTLLTGAPAGDNLDRLAWLMSRFTGYVGVTPYQGARFTADKKAMAPVIEALSARGLLYLDNGASRRSVAGPLTAGQNMPSAKSDRIIDPSLSADAIASSLEALEKRAQSTGLAIGTGSGFPITVEKIGAWVDTLEEAGITLIPVSAAIERKMETAQE